MGQSGTPYQLLIDLLLLSVTIVTFHVGVHYFLICDMLRNRTPLHIAQHHVGVITRTENNNGWIPNSKINLSYGEQMPLKQRVKPAEILLSPPLSTFPDQVAASLASPCKESY